MIEIKRKIHVIGINSFEFQELPIKLQKLFLETSNILDETSYLSNTSKIDINDAHSKYHQLFL